MDFLNMGFIQELFVSTIRMATPLLLVALGELFSEKAGMVNIGLDGIMTFGALSGFLVSYITGSPYLGILAGALGGLIINLIYAFCTVTLCAEQIVYGMALNIFAPAVATFIYRMYFGITPTLATASLMKAVPIPWLSEIPIIGKAFFNHTPIVYMAYILVPIIAFFFNKTKPGLNFKAVGEFPKAAETLGINVTGKKYLACILCGTLAGMGGAYLTTCYISSFSEGIVAGRGFIALAAVIFGRWMPGGVVLAALLFSFSDALQLRFQVLSPNTPYQLLAMLPYVFTLAALAILGIKKGGPKANGKPYFREDR